MATGGSYSCVDGANGGGVGGGAGFQCVTRRVDRGSIQSLRYYLSRRTVLEMLRDRGYDVPQSDLTCSLAVFRLVFGDQPELESLRISASLRSNPSRKLLVIFMGTEEIRKADISGLDIPNKDSLQGLMLILQSKMNHFSRKELLTWPLKVEIFQITDLLVNISKHILKPTCEVLTTHQKQQMLNKYMSEDKQLPRILVNDAIARYYGLEKGQVVKITYSGGLVDSFVTYRCIT